MVYISISLDYEDVLKTSGLFGLVAKFILSFPLFSLYCLMCESN